MMRRILPHPYLTMLLVVVWIMLVNRLTPGNLLLGLGLGIVIPMLTAPYWPDAPQLRNWRKITEYCLLVVWDICVANVVVARQILFMRNDELASAWVTVPLDLRSPEAITVLAGTVTMTPGTVSSDLSACGTALLVHCLHAPDPEAIRDQIKSRYETRLKEIFE